MKKEKLDKILKNHELWLNNEGGKRADLSGVDLSNTDLNGVDLERVDLSNANLKLADLSNANLKLANLYGANLYGANLYNANLSNADLYEGNLYGTILRNANLNKADLRNANLNKANLKNANLNNIKTNIYTIGYNLACPEEGSFIGYKKAGKYIVKLLILEDSKRSSATTLKCRCDKAKVLDIEEIGTGEKIESTPSDYDINFVYKIGEIVKVDNFDENRWHECTTGIHFFINKQNAIQY